MTDKIRFMTIAAATLTAAPLWTGAALAATMTFDTLPDEGAQLHTYWQNGIRATALGGVLAYEWVPGSAHIDDAGTGHANGVQFTMGGVFDAVGFDLVSYGYQFFDPPDPLSDNITVTGFLGGAAIANTSFLLSDIAGQAQSFLLGSSFGGIDMLQIVLNYPLNSAMCDAPCGHFDLTSVTLNGPPAPVPLPASALMLMAASAMLAGVRARGCQAS